MRVKLNEGLRFAEASPPSVLSSSTKCADRIINHIKIDDSYNTSKIFEHTHMPYPRRHSTLDVHAEIFVPRSAKFISADNLKCQVRSHSSEGFLNPYAKSFEHFSSTNEPILSSARDDFL